jgi:hypothetical protein
VCDCVSQTSVTQFASEASNTNNDPEGQNSSKIKYMNINKVTMDLLEMNLNHHPIPDYGKITPSLSI